MLQSQKSMINFILHLKKIGQEAVFLCSDFKSYSFQTWDLSTILDQLIPKIKFSNSHKNSLLKWRFESYKPGLLWVWTTGVLTPCVLSDAASCTAFLAPNLFGIL